MPGRTKQQLDANLQGLVQDLPEGMHPLLPTCLFSMARRQHFPTLPQPLHRSYQMITLSIPKSAPAVICGRLLDLITVAANGKHALYWLGT